MGGKKESKKVKIKKYNNIIYCYYSTGATTISGYRIEDQLTRALLSSDDIVVAVVITGAVFSLALLHRAYNIHFVHRFQYYLGRLCLSVFKVKPYIFH